MDLFELARRMEFEFSEKEKAIKLTGFFRCLCGKIHARHLAVNAKCSCGLTLNPWK